jgi:RNA polymerase sigma factor (sigma-70 family)
MSELLTCTPRPKRRKSLLPNFSEPLLCPNRTLDVMAAMSTKPHAAKQTNPDLADMVRDHQASIWRYLRFLDVPTEEAEDLTQETFLALAESIRQSNFEQRSPGQTAAYLRTVARNQLLMARRKQDREINMVELTAADTAWAEATGEHGIDNYLEYLAYCLKNGLKNTDGRARKVIDEFYRYQQSRREIAKAMNMTPDGVKTLLRRTRDLLRKCIERQIHSVRGG